jgi:hypothetical protein
MASYDTCTSAQMYGMPGVSTPCKDAAAAVIRGYRQVMYHNDVCAAYFALVPLAGQ